MKIKNFVQVLTVLGITITWQAWMPPAASLRAEESVKQVEKLIDAGNPQVILTLRRWLADASERVGQTQNDARLLIAMRGAGAFHDENCDKILAWYYAHQSAPRAVKLAAADALAVIGTAETEVLLKLVWDRNLPLPTRCRAAAALVQRDQEVGRQFLLSYYDLYRWEHKTADGWKLAPVREVLTKLDDEKIVASLADRLPQETDLRMRNNITTLREVMQLNGLPVDELAAIAKNTSWKDGMYRRYPAIEAIGRKGTPESIPLLETLQPWATVDTGAVAGQQQFLKDYAAAAVAAIKRRHWKESDLE